MSNNISRRAFLKGSAALSLATASATLLTGCSLDDLSDFLGLGPRKKAFTIGDFSLRFTLTGWKFSRSSNEIVLTFDVENQFFNTVSISPISPLDGSISPDDEYYVVPALTSGDKPLSFKYPTNGFPSVPSGQTQTCELVGVFDSTPGLWAHVQLTLTLYNKGEAVNSVEPIVFDFSI